MIRVYLTLNPACSAARRDMADVYALHRTVLSLFPAALPPGERVLFRLEEDERPGLLVQSLVACPVVSRLPVGYLAADAAPGVVDPPPSGVETLRFRLRANPTRRVDGRRIALAAEAWPDWLARKGQQSGFRVVEMAAVGCGTVVGYRPTDGAAESAGLVQAVRLRSVEFTGRLAVTDRIRLVDALRNGVGSGKGFGFGLLTVGAA